MSSRFRDMWVSGKFAVERKSKDVVDDRAEKEAAQMLHQLIPEPAQQMYQDLSKRRGSETGRWLNDLAGDAPSAQADWLTAHENAGDTFDEARVWIDALFQEFSSLSYGFNDKAVGTDLFVSCEKPGVVETRDDDVWYHPVTKTYQGRLTTRMWCLFARGNEEKISVYIFPAEMTIGFKSGHYSDDEVPPFLVADHKSEGGKNSWNIQGGEASLATIPALAKELFGDLIRMASGKMSDTELFNRKSEAPQLGQNVAVGYDLQGQQQAQAPEKQATQTVVIDEASVFEACDLLDKVIDKELKRLYQQSSKLSPGSPQADQARKQISSVETFRMKVVDAFENFTKDSHTITAADTAVTAGKS